MKIYVHGDDGDQLQFDDLADAINYAEELIGDADKEITITIYVAEEVEHLLG